MADNQEYEAVLAIEDDQNTVSNKGTGKGSEQEITRSPQEDIALVRVEGRKETDEDEKSDNGREQAPLLWIVDKAPYNTVRETLTAKALMDSGGNTLLLAIKIIGRLKERASGSDCPGDFIDLANRVEEFTLRFLDPLKHDSLESVMFLKSSEKDFILEKATKFELKKFCEHPVIMDIIDDRWYTPIFHERWTPFIWFIWALFDVILLPITLPLLYVLGLKFDRFEFMYKYCFRIPYIIFLRDTMSSVALVGLHFWICLEPSQLAFSHLEWAILVFLFGRLVLEFTQIAQVARVKDNKMRQFKNYLRDRWNIFDLVILFTYFCAILPLRVVTWASSETETNNRALLVAGYLYGFNMMLLTFRTFGSFLEIFEGVGTIQIALFNIIKDACVIVLHFIVITLGFSSTVTKVLAAGNSMVAKDKEQYSTCNKTGIHCWWEITAQLGLSLLDLSDGLDFFKSADSVSQTLSRLLFAAYLVIALILLINMLIALLSNTYQRVQDNSRKEWAFQKAITVQTYSNFHPIPVPFNIISIPVMVLPCVRKIPRRLRMEKLRWYGDSPSTRAITRLQAKYRLKYGDSFPSTDPQDPLLEGINDTVGVVNQVLYGTDQRGSDPALLVNDGPQAWDSHEDIAVEGVLLSCTLKTDESCEDIIIRGARYHTPFSPESPHFEIMTWEPGESMWLCVGVVFGDHNTEFAPGDKRTASIGFDARAGRIYDADTKYSNGKKATGPAVCHRGDTIRVTVMFGDKLERDGKFQVPVVFTVNGSRIVPEGNEAFIVYSPDKPYIYPYISFRSSTSVQDKVVMKDDLGHQDLQMQGVKSELSETKANLRAVKTGRSEMVMKEDLDHQDLQLQEVKSELTKTKSQLQAVKSELSEVKSKLAQVNQSLERKLDAMLAKLQ